MALWRVGVDVGGTFTDLVAVNEDTAERIHLKVSTTPSRPAEGFLDAIGELKKRQTDEEPIGLIFHGTTLATNAIIERRIAKTALVTTEGFRDVLEIGRHWRADLYDLTQDHPEALVPRPLRFGIPERVGPHGDVIAPLDRERIDPLLSELDEAGVEAVAVVFLHAYANAEHEDEFIAAVRERFPDHYACGSSEISREPREFERTSTTVLNAALMPLIDAYLTHLERALGENGSTPRLYITHSNGGALSPDAARRRPVGLAQSGPVAGVQSCIRIGERLGFKDVIGFDMGGTSADIALVEDGEPRLSSELHIGGLPVRLPSVQVHSIGAGGGSIAWLDEVGALKVGPRSAGATPGPACYGRGGTEPTITDCNVVLGRMPARRRLAGFLELDVEAARTAVATIAEPLGLSVEEAAEGVIDVVNAEMEGAVRVVLRERGNDPRDFALVAFGGAGPMHAVELAGQLSMETVIVPRFPGTFSAEGLLTSDLRQDFAVSRPIRSDDPEAAQKLAAAYEELERHAREELADDPDFAGELGRERRCEVRYLGQAYEVSVPLSVNGNGVDRGAFDELVAEFHRLHHRAYAFAEEAEPCEIRTQRLFLTAAVGGKLEDEALEARAAETEETEFIFEGETIRCPIVERSSLAPGDSVPVPCIIAQEDTTTFIPPGVSGKVADSGDIILKTGGTA